MFLVFVIEATASLTLTFDQKGISSLVYRGEELIHPNRKVQLSTWDVEGHSQSLTRGGGDIHCKNGVMSLANDQLCVSTRFTIDGDHLILDSSIENTGGRSIAKLSFHPLSLKFPDRPKGRSWVPGYDSHVNTAQAPAISVADWGRSKLILCVPPEQGEVVEEQPVHPMTLGYAGHFGNWDYNLLRFIKSFQQPLEPGEKWSFRAVLRFAPGDKPTPEVAADIYKAYAEEYPAFLKWSDRRPIGALFMSRSAKEWPTNPRGWLHSPEFDVTTPEGKEDLHKHLLEYADRSVLEIKRVGGQGMIVWDLEGQEMPHAISYLGDPRIVPRAAPEMDEVADAFFKRFLDAGLKTGVCIRPSKVIPNGKGGWKHRQVDDPVAEMSDKIRYAQKRWGCTIIYIDSPVLWELKPADSKDVTRGMWQGRSRLIPSWMMRKLGRLHPDVLIIPEFAEFGYFGATSVYAQLKGWMPNKMPEGVRAVYPDAFHAIYTPSGDFLGNWDPLLKGVLRGDIHIFRGWYDDHYNRYEKLMYDEASYIKQAEVLEIAGDPLTSLKSDDPVVRYAGLERVGAPTGEQTRALVAQLSTERDAIIKRKIIELLGASSGNMEAVSALTEVIKDKDDVLGHFAILSLGRVGSVATPVLLSLLEERNPYAQQATLKALSMSKEHHEAREELLELASGGDARLRPGAVKALGKQSGDKVVECLLELTKHEDQDTAAAACHALASLKEKSAIDTLIEVLETRTRDHKVRRAAGRAMEALTGYKYHFYFKRWKKLRQAGKI
jgi:hypothetical protein